MAAGARGPRRGRTVRAGRAARGERRGAGGSGAGRGLRGRRRRGRGGGSGRALGGGAGCGGAAGAERGGARGGPEGGFSPASGSAPLSSPRRNGADGRERDLHPQVRGGAGRFPPVVGTAAPRVCAAPVPASASPPSSVGSAPSRAVPNPPPPPRVPWPWDRGGCDRARRPVPPGAARCHVGRRPFPGAHPHRFLWGSGGTALGPCGAIAPNGALAERWGRSGSVPSAPSRGRPGAGSAAGAAFPLSNFSTRSCGATGAPQRVV